MRVLTHDELMAVTAAVCDRRLELPPDDLERSLLAGVRESLERAAAFMLCIERRAAEQVKP